MMMLNKNQVRMLMFVVGVAEFEGLRYWEELKQSFDGEFETMEEAIDDLLEAIGREPVSLNPRQEKAMAAIKAARASEQECS